MESQRVIEESSMRRDIQKKPLGYGLTSQKELTQYRKLFYRNSSKYEFALQTESYRQQQKNFEE